MGFVQDPPRLGNQYDDDRVLKGWLRRNLRPETLTRVEPELREMGALTAGPLLELSLRHRNDLPVHVPFDPWGRRVDTVQVNAAWQEYARVATRFGLVGRAYERRGDPDARLEQMALVYLFERSAQSYTCPLAMTDGAARTLAELAPPALRDRILPRLISRDPAQAWTSGQWMTERTGGSDVGLTETVARREGDAWRLYGDKWFTSAVTSDVALTLARPEGNPAGGKGLALFAVILRDAEGRLQNIRVHRLKDKLGTRQLPTAELSLEGTPATPVAELGDGIRNMRFMLNLTRTWNAVCATAGMRRGLALARDYAKRRVAFGAPLSEKPLHLETLADLAAEQEAAFHLVFNSVRLLGRQEAGLITPTEARLLAALQPLAKLTTGKQAVAVASEVLECFGGAGYVEDTGLPEILRDNQVLSIWEGTTNVLALESLRTLRREDALGVCLETLTTNGRAATDPRLAAAGKTLLASAAHIGEMLPALLADPATLEASARRIALSLGRSLALAFLLEHATFCLGQGDLGPARAAARFARLGVDLLAAPTPLEETRALAMDTP